MAEKVSAMPLYVLNKMTHNWKHMSALIRTAYSFFPFYNIQKCSFPMVIQRNNKKCSSCILT